MVSNGLDCTKHDLIIVITTGIGFIRSNVHTLIVHMYIVFPIDFYAHQNNVRNILIYIGLNVTEKLDLG